MFKKLLLAGVFMATPMAMADTAEAHCRPGHRSSVTVYRTPSHHHHHHHHDHYRSRSSRGYSVYRYGNVYRPNYRSYYRGYSSPYRGSGYGYGYSPYRRGTSIGIGRGGIRLNFGF